MCGAKSPAINHHPCPYLGQFISNCIHFYNFVDTKRCCNYYFKNNISYFDKYGKNVFVLARSLINFEVYCDYVNVDLESIHYA